MSDLCVITARDARQARLFQSQIEALTRAGALPAGLRSLVVPDPPGAPLGTAGATLYALCAAADAVGAGAGPPLAGRRVFVVHCGGLSQRLPQFAQLGKVFTPLPHSGWAPNPLLAEVLRGLLRLAEGMAEGVFVACGDVLYTCRAPAPLAGVAAAVFVAPAPPEQAAHHGVYDWDQVTGLATRVFQKPDLETQRAAGLIREGAAWLDTGIVYLSPPVVRAWLGLVPAGTGTRRDRLARDRARWVGVEFYQHVTGAMIASAGPSPLRDALGVFQLGVLAPPDGRFLHFGTTAELIHLLCSRQWGAAGGLAWVHPSARREATSLVQSAILGSADSRLGPFSLVHYSDAPAGLDLPGRNHVLGLRGRRPVRLPEGTMLYQAPVRGAGGGDALVLLGVGDSPKQRAADGIRFLGGDLEEWVGARGLSATDVWPDVAPARRTLWNARLFPTGRANEVLECIPHMVEGPRPAGRTMAPRVSMEDVQRRFDVRRWRRFEESLHARLLAISLTGAVEHGEAARELLAHTASTPYGARVAAALRPHALRERRPLRAARLWQACAVLTAPPEGDSPVVETGGRAGHAQARAWAAIQAAVGPAPERPTAPAWLTRPGAWAEAEAPVRVDLAGGWTDTPPQAMELGGAVLNVAFLLQGSHPIRARATVTATPTVELVAHDLEQRIEMVSERELRACTDPGDPFALHKAALCEAGILSARTRSLARRLERHGVGLRLETDSRVPKGSGLGTSSILGAAALAALNGVSGGALDISGLCNQVLRLEQRLTTGGGWQDQVGALDGGFKCAFTSPGQDQTPAIHRLPVPEAVLRAFEERVVLYYTGLPRLARNVLQRVVARYLLREPRVMDALAEMPGLVARLEAALLTGDLAAVGAVMTRSWELNQSIEPTATNPEVDRLFAAIRPHVLGAKLAGAGGGGFLLALAREPGDTRRIRQALAQAGADPTGWFPAQVAQGGLRLVTGR